MSARDLLLVSPELALVVLAVVIVLLDLLGRQVRARVPLAATAAA